MSEGELLSEIERLRYKMNSLANNGVDFQAILSVSQELDKLIVMYHKTTL